MLTRLTIIITSQYVLWCTQSCPTLWDPMDCSPPGFSVHGDSPGNNTGVGCCVLLQGIFPTQGSNPGLPHCRWILYHLSHQGSPLGFQYSYTGVSSLSFLQGNFPTQELNWGLLHCRQILYQLSYQGSPVLIYVNAYFYIPVFTPISSLFPLINLIPISGLPRWH